MVKTKEATLEAETKNVYEQMCRMIGTHINREREKKGISLREMYRRTNISIAVMSDIENGLKLPRIETLIKLLIELEIPLSDIFGSMAYQDFSMYKGKVIKNYMRELEDNAQAPFLLSLDFSKDELKEITDFVAYIKFKRNRNKNS